jgi:hypothetical protein
VLPDFAPEIAEELDRLFDDLEKWFLHGDTPGLRGCCDRTTFLILSRT